MILKLIVRYDSQIPYKNFISKYFIIPIFSSCIPTVSRFIRKCYYLRNLSLYFMQRESVRQLSH